MSTVTDFSTEPLARLRERTRRSSELEQLTRARIPQVAVGTLNVSLPIYVDSSSGSRIVDVDGNEYIDLTMGFGVQVLGHAPRLVRDALLAVADRGFQHAMHSAYQQPLAALIQAAHPNNEQVLFCNSGTEATLHAIRLARGYTGKTKIALFEGSYHGAHDYCMVGADPDSPASQPRMVPRGRGIPRESLSTMVMLPYWDDRALDMIREQRDELAVVLIEPVQGGNPQTQQGPWLGALRDVCTECGVLLLFDEVITGFRLGFGGGQAMFDIEADIATYGKILGGGLPIGAVTARSELIELFAPDAVDGVFAAGTFSGNPASMVTGTATLEHLLSHPGIYEQLHRQSNWLAGELNTFFSDEMMPARVFAADSILFIKLVNRDVEVRCTRDAPLDPVRAKIYDGIQLRLLEKGVMLPGSHQFHLSAAHSDDDIAHVIASCKEVFQEARDAGAL